MAETDTRISVGVLIPVYNRPRELRAAIASVQSQTFRPEQIVIVDDGSDPPVHVPGDLTTTIPIHLIRIPFNQGPAAARQAGLEALDTTHVAFLDADDTWDESKLQHQVAHLRSLPEPHTTVIACGWTWVTADGTTISHRMPRSSRNLADFCSGCWYCPGSTALVSREFLIEIGGYDTRLRRLEDFDLFLRLALAGGTLEVTQIVGTKIRKGRNALRKTVDPAAQLLRQKYLSANSPVKTADLHRRIDSWLAVEEAAAAINENDFAKGFARLIHSFIRVPRLSIQIGDWTAPP